MLSRAPKTRKRSNYPLSRSPLLASEALPKLRFREVERQALFKVLLHLLSVGSELSPVTLFAVLPILRCFLNQYSEILGVGLLPVDVLEASPT